jgi:hypothetical protein
VHLQFGTSVTHSASFSNSQKQKQKHININKNKDKYRDRNEINDGWHIIFQNSACISHLAFVYGHIDAIKTCVCAGEHFHILVTEYCKFTNIPIIALTKKSKRNIRNIAINEAKDFSSKIRKVSVILINKTNQQKRGRKEWIVEGTCKNSKP